MLSDSLTDWPSIKKVGRAQAADAVMDQLVAQIRRGDVTIGQRLPPESTLARAFGVSRPVVREALRGMRSLGLITSRAGSGSYVSDANTLGRAVLLGRYPATELHEVRTHLEVPAANLAARRATAAQIRDLLDIMDRMSTTSDHHAYAELDAQFHVALAKCTGNSIHTRLVADLHELIVENSDLALSADQARRAQATREHRAIADAVAHRDAEAAEKAVRRHLARVSRLLSSRFQGAVSPKRIEGEARHGNRDQT